ncbi:MAG: 16S rRNA (guanine(527)-N(7))-methyltransferase RsmG [Chlorobium sp.]
MEQLNNNFATLKTLCAEQAIGTDPLMLQKLVHFGDCLEQWNRKINLISRKEDAPIIIKHIFHSLLITRYHSFKKGEQVLDLGTGGGLPGIPLAIIFPDTHFLLVDATGKKIMACQEMIKELGISNAVAMHIRVEELKGVMFDTVLSRQVASLDKLCVYAGKLLKPKGILICLKGGNLETEISRALISGKKYNGFPTSIKQYPIHEISPFFSEKQIVIASR